jgi:hypothetical protein
MSPNLNPFFAAFDKTLSGNAPGNLYQEILTPLSNDVRELSDAYYSFADLCERLDDRKFSSLSEFNTLCLSIAEKKVNYRNILQRVLEGFRKVGRSFEGEFIHQLTNEGIPDIRFR